VLHKLLYTEGVTHARDRFFGLKRLRMCLRASLGAPAQEVCDQLLHAVNRYQDVAPQHDDVTLVAVRAAS
jgi:serine phosphatase RsbU (regulator of sigma subunit)